MGERAAARTAGRRSVCAHSRKASDTSGGEICLPEAAGRGSSLPRLPVACCIYTAAVVRAELGTQPFAHLLNPHPFARLRQRALPLAGEAGCPEGSDAGLTAVKHFPARTDHLCFSARVYVGVFMGRCAYVRASVCVITRVCSHVHINLCLLCT